MNENKFWASIENAWLAAPSLKEKRKELLSTTAPANPSRLALQFNGVLEENVFNALLTNLSNLSKEDCFHFNLILEQKLYDLDRQILHQYVGGNEKEFLLRRGFIVGMGKDYYYAILKMPSLAIPQLESEAFSYLTRYHYNKWFSAVVTDFSVSRWSRSNVEYWQREGKR